MNLDQFDVIFEREPHWAVILIIGAVIIVFLIWNARYKAKGTLWRLLALASITLAVFNPILISNERQLRKDIIILAVDRTKSQGINDRKEIQDEILFKVRQKLISQKNLDTKILEINEEPKLDPSETINEGSLFFGKLKKMLTEIRPEEMAGIIFLTDGQIHDVKDASNFSSYDFPLHVLLTGKRNERVRSLKLKNAPDFGFIGNQIKINLIIKDNYDSIKNSTRLSVKLNGKLLNRNLVPVNEPFELMVPVNHAGKNIFQISIEEKKGELSYKNNQVSFKINGVRERLRILMVSGAPNTGQKTWRKLLKSDPNVDLIHFTILRPPSKIDNTPRKDLSLIAFPLDQIFNKQLNKFDLIVLDQYRNRGILSRTYLENIVGFVVKGGALFEISGPASATSRGAAQTPLRKLLPAVPNGKIIEMAFRPQLTIKGLRHPITANLSTTGVTNNINFPKTYISWGRWFRLIESQIVKGDVLMEGAFGKPLLITARVGKGRVAQLLSDHIWLWDKGYEGGGPYRELIRRTSHWLMKEPDLEENSLTIKSHGQNIKAISRSIENIFSEITMLRPDGSKEAKTPKQTSHGEASAYFKNIGPGLYKASNQLSNDIASLGYSHTKEYFDLRTTPRILNPIVKMSGGKIFWAGEDGVPDIRRVAHGHSVSGKNWLGIRSNKNYVTTDSVRTPLGQPMLWLFLIIVFSFLAWRREAS